MFLMFSCTPENKSMELFVNPTEQAKGDKSEVNPFSTIPEAIKKAEEVKKSFPKTKITITLLKGEYYLEEPVVIKPLLNGLTITGVDASQVHIKGSQLLHPIWQKYEDKIYITEVPANIDFDQLIINGTPQVLARYPNYNEKGGYWQGYAADAISKKEYLHGKILLDPFFMYFIMENGADSIIE